MKAARKAAEQPQDIRETLEKGDEAVAKLMMELAGLQPGNHRMAAKDDEVIRRIARALDPDTCKVLSFASKSNVQLDQIDLKSRTEMRPSSHPADTFEVESMKSDDQFGSVIPEELALPDEVFWQQVGEDSLHVVQHYEEVEKIRRLYMLLDVSGSMDESVSGTEATRMQWGAGVALKLMMRAQAGEAEYLLRLFDDEVYQLYQVTNASEAAKMVNLLVRLQGTGGGTNIQAALSAAVDDMAKSDQEIETSDVLLISDGESPLDEAWLRRTFGGKLRLHVAMIDLHNPLLADPSISSSYETYG
ncbi:MAG TPA: VWA domain-containing protein [Nocardioides sp.]|nr:VWA domain-containing protein [Nocardioides sp.]